MVGEAPGLRASDADRERALRALRSAVGEGRISTDTFLLRVDAVLGSTSRLTIDATIADLRPRRARGDRLVRAVARASAFVRKIGRSARVPWMAPLFLPDESGKALTIGRSPDCDLILRHPTISRRHAVLRPRLQGWELVDLGSTNGTRVNGWQLAVAQPLHEGDVVSFGALSLAVTAR